jgi:hypothetical protein
MAEHLPNRYPEKEAQNTLKRPFATRLPKISLTIKAINRNMRLGRQGRLNI